MRWHDLGVRRRDLLSQLTDALADVDPMLDPHPWRSQLAELARRPAWPSAPPPARWPRSTATSSTTSPPAGVGADVIVGTRLPSSRGIGGFVAMTGQALAVDHPAGDARFARDVADRTGYVPDTLLVVPVLDERATSSASSACSTGRSDRRRARAGVGVRRARRPRRRPDAWGDPHVLAGARSVRRRPRHAASPTSRRRCGGPSPARPAGDGDLAAIAATLNTMPGEPIRRQRRRIAAVDRRDRRPLPPAAAPMTDIRPAWSEAFLDGVAPARAPRCCRAS